MSLNLNLAIVYVIMYTRTCFPLLPSSTVPSIIAWAGAIYQTCSFSNRVFFRMNSLGLLSLPVNYEMEEMRDCLRLERGWSEGERCIVI
jgi:hypothetical protein